MSTAIEIDIFWFKRDLRLQDNTALKTAAQSKRKLLMIYLYEPLIWQNDHYSERHFRFVFESLTDLNRSLEKQNTEVLCVNTEIIQFISVLLKEFRIHTIFSTEETGLAITYQRDVALSAYCKDKGIYWKEFQNNGVVRGMKNRKLWRKMWYDHMYIECESVNWEGTLLFSREEINYVSKKFQPLPNIEEQHKFQREGREQALQWKKSFFGERLEYYSKYISKPEMAKFGCSRLSPYLAWGNLSVREIFQEAMALKEESKHKRQLNAFVSRLRWQSHFIQKFEMEHRMEFEAVNKGFLDLEQPINVEFYQRWKDGKTGYPLVDASMRCVTQTGYINFRMRSMVTSFLCHHLFQHFTVGSSWLARQFLDFEPGIHYGQMQMQAGFTGTNTVRVYNPVKNAHEHDSEGVFIKKYVPELQELPVNLALEPWTITQMEEELYNFKYGGDYPKRIVDISETRKIALQKLYGQRKSELSKNEKARILETHTIPRRKKE